jgi:UDP-N-acetylmuramoyl-tripeptide--D-alanyl-D-alanine ligase
MNMVPVPEIVLTGSQIRQALGCGQPLAADEKLVVSGVCTDSRRIQPGHLFFCLRGEIFDGHDFIAQAVDAGAAALVVAASSVNQQALSAAYPKISFFPVADPLRALGDLAAWWLRYLDVRVIAVTGSNGKTTTREMILGILSRKLEVHGNRENLNNLIGVPLTILEAKKHHQTVVLELGMNCPGEIARLAAIARPHGVVLTNVAEAHLEGVGSVDDVAAAKGEIFQGLRDGGYIVYNADDERLSELVSRKTAGNGSWELVPVSLNSDSSGELRVDGLAAAASGTRFSLATASGAQPVSLPLWGRHNVMNALLAAEVGRQEGFSLAEISCGLSRVSLPAGRLAVHEPAPGRVLIDDSYNANPASMEASLQVLSEMRGDDYAVAILGDMFELGENSASLHARVGVAAARVRPDLLVTYGDRSQVTARAAVAAGMPARCVLSFVVGQEDDLLEDVCRRLADRCLILVKGSRGMAMDKLVERLLAREGTIT